MSEISASRKSNKSRATRHILKDSYVRRQKNLIPRTHSAAIFDQAHKLEDLTTLFFEEEEYDDDPFYEIYDCHKMTFLES